MVAFVPVLAFVHAVLIGVEHRVQYVNFVSILKLNKNESIFVQLFARQPVPMVVHVMEEATRVHVLQHGPICDVQRVRYNIDSV